MSADVDRHENVEGGPTSRQYKWEGSLYPDRTLRLLWEAMDEQVEQDLVLCRALVEMFEDTDLANDVALRGGTALRKLHFSPARRYSEDIDLVQLRPAPIGPTIDRIRAKLDSWLGEPKCERGEGMRLIYRFESENLPVIRLRLKIETNTREHLAVRGTTKRSFSVESRWWQGRADITTFEIEELLATNWFIACGGLWGKRAIPEH